ncbi:MAG TPA: DHA2 family efflux MFS transporter permease subunit [Jatrophihabitans sp.]
MTTTDKTDKTHPGAVAKRASHPALALLIIAGTQLMIVLDATIVNIALPSMGHYFHKSQTDMTWAINAYTLAFGGLLLLGGKAGDILGRRRMFMVGLGLFTAGSLLGGLAQNFEMLMIGRVIQGVGGAISSPTALALITTEFDEGKERTRALAVFSAVAGAGAALGLLLGGILTDVLTWRWVLFVNVPIGIALVAGAYFYLHESERQTGKFDYRGGLTSTVGMTALVYGFIHAASHGWGNSQTIGSFAVAAVLLIAFVALQVRLGEHAMMPLHIFSNRSRSGAYIVMLIIGAAMFGMFYFLTFFVQQNLHFSPLKSGFAFLPVAFTIGIAAQLAAKFMARLGPRNLIVAGAAIMTAGLFWLSTIDSTSKYATHILPSMVVLAFGIGMIFVPLMTVVVTGVEPREAGLASALLNVGQQVGGSIGLSVLATVAATSGKNAATNEVGKFLASGNKGSVQHFVELQKQSQGNFVASAAARADGAAQHAVSVVGAHAASMGFLAAAIFGVVALLAGIGMIKTGKTDVANVETPLPVP